MKKKPTKTATRRPDKKKVRDTLARARKAFAKTPLKRKPRLKPKTPVRRSNIVPTGRSKKAKATGKASFKRHNMRVTASSVKMDWRTPPSLLKLIEKVAGPIILDPSADKNKKHQFAKYNVTGEHRHNDGLTKTWRGFGVVYCNPPYGRGIIKWIKKAVTEVMTQTISDTNDHVFMLVPARPDTKWFQKELLPYVTSLCFWRGRMKFSGHKDSAPFPQLIIYFGSKPKRFRKVFKKHGWVPKVIG